MTISLPGFYQMIQHYQEAQLLLAGIKLELFSYLATFTSPAVISSKTGFNERNLKLFLNSLVAIDLLEKKGDCYKNKPAVNSYLNKNQRLYLGEYILFREEMTSLARVEELVRNGPDEEIVQNNQGVEFYDFYKLARVSINEMYTGRIQSLLKAVKLLFGKKDSFKLLDLGGGSGIMALELLKNYPAATAVIFEHPTVVRLPEELVAVKGLAERVTVLAGDFTVDDLGANYDLIIASGILNFAKDKLVDLIKKLQRALRADGYLHLIVHQVNQDYTAPREAIVGWLSSHLTGLDLLLNKQTIDEALAAGGFKLLDRAAVAGIMDNLVGDFYIKT